MIIDMYHRIIILVLNFFFSPFLQEAKQALELMGRWETIDVCDALELLSPVFKSEEVRVL